MDRFAWPVACREAVVPRSRCTPKPGGVRSEPQRGGFTVARGKPRFAAPPRVSPRPAHRGRAHDHECNRRCPSPPRAAPCLVATEPGPAPVRITPSKAREAVRGLFRSRRPPVWHTVLGSPGMFAGTCTRGGAAKRGLPRAMLPTAALRLRRKTRVSRIREFKWVGTHSADSEAQLRNRNRNHHQGILSWLSPSHPTPTLGMFVLEFLISLETRRLAIRLMQWARFAALPAIRLIPVHSGVRRFRNAGRNHARNVPPINHSRSEEHCHASTFSENRHPIRNEQK